MFPFLSPSSFSISGTTGSGKTSFLKKLLENKELMFTSPPNKILYCYGVWQDLFNEMESAIPNLYFNEGIPSSELINEFTDYKHNVIVLDDLMTECLKNDEIELLFTRGAHHKKLSVIYLNQNMFCQGKHARTIALNCHYMILFQNLRDCSQVQRLGQQLFPNNSHVLVEAYKDCLQKPFGYLVIDLSPSTEHTFRLRTDIFPSEITKVYLPHGAKAL